MTTHVRTIVSKMAVAALLAGVMLVMAGPPACAQGIQNASQQYGLTPWALNNQRVASQFNYVVDSLAAVGSPASFTFPANVCVSALPSARNGSANAFPAGASVKIIDVASANTETVNLATTPVTFAGGNCTINMSSVANTHLSYRLRSGTCGLLEAIADLGVSGGAVIVTQEFYDQGCTQATITGVAVGNVHANINIVDISNGQATWYGAHATTLTASAAPAAPTTATVAGGTFTNGNVLVSVSYTDPLGGETAASSETTQATGGTTNGITVTSPIAQTGMTGYRVYMTSVGGSTLAGVLHMPAGACTLVSPQPPTGPACALGANATVLAPITSTAKIPNIATAHAAYGYQPLSMPPAAFSPTSGLGQVQTSFGPQILGISSAAPATLNSSNEDLAAITFEPGYFNTLSKLFLVCAKINTATQVATSAATVTIKASNAYNQSPVTLETIVFTTQTQAAAGTINGCSYLQVTAAGASGTFTAFSPAAWLNYLSSAPATVITSNDKTTAASSTIDLTKQVTITLNMAETVGANITGPVASMFFVVPVATN